ncbi:MAG: hypothetical protein K2H90_01420 [Oscillospiraceae bacterium]|nr:hypothetical protein [Oscillospiraceae bacterium]
MITKEEMFNEALSRTYLLGLPPCVVYNLIYSNVRTVSMPGGNVADMSEEYQFFIDTFEEETGAFVYHAIVDEFKDKRFLYLLFVHPDDFEDREFLKITHELISKPHVFKEKSPVLIAQRIDIDRHGFKIVKDAIAINVIAELNNGLKYSGLAKVSRNFRYVS